MSFISVFNDVLGPVMRGPSSSHTAGSFRIGRITRDLLGEKPEKVTFSFDPAGSYANVYRQQGVDLAFATGIMARPITDSRFEDALNEAERDGIRIDFQVVGLKGAGHPNTVEIEAIGVSGRRLNVVARSTGGGGISIDRIDGDSVRLDGKAYEIVVSGGATQEIDRIASEAGWEMRAPNVPRVFRAQDRPEDETLAALRDLAGASPRVSEPVFFIRRADPMFDSYSGMLKTAEERGGSLGEAAIAGEGRLLGMSRNEVLSETLNRYRVMRESVEAGMDPRRVRMQLLEPTAHRIFQAEAVGKVTVGGLHTRAAARAMAVMHISNSQGTVCAAPTGGAAGALPGVMVTLEEEIGLEKERLARSLMAAGAAGWLIARLATFAAEVAGCQVEIGAAGAMAAAAVVDAFGGSPRQACDAAAVSLQNSMGSVCDLVQGICEIPCHTRNAVAASSAFVCADLVLGGYVNPVPLDETIDAVYSVGRMLPVELRCTAKGGLAVAPSAKNLPRLR